MWPPLPGRCVSHGPIVCMQCARRGARKKRNRPLARTQNHPFPLTFTRVLDPTRSKAATIETPFLAGPKKEKEKGGKVLVGNASSFFPAPFPADRESGPFLPPPWPYSEEEEERCFACPQGWEKGMWENGKCMVGRCRIDYCSVFPPFSSVWI